MSILDIYLSRKSFTVTYFRLFAEGPQREPSNLYSKHLIRSHLENKTKFLEKKMTF